MKKICCITGTRADYPRVRSVLKKIQKHPKFNLDIIVTGSHLLEDYGFSYKEILNDGFEISKKVNMFEGNFNTTVGMAQASAKCTDGIARALNELKPDLVLLTVDRVETLAAITAASLMNFPIAHIQGGEITGTIDEVLRHAITKLAHIHFPATKDAKDRILKLGENPDLVFQTGCPYIDELHSYKLKTKEELSKKYNFNNKKIWVIFTQHSVTTEHNESLEQVKVTIDALKNYPNLEVISFFSNTDAGGREIIEENKKQSNFKIIPNMKSDDFASLMKVSQFMIGNSSSGIREAPTFGLPAINIGTRQKGRLRASNVIDVNHNKVEIIESIKKCLNDNIFLASLKKIDNPYGDGKSAEKIVKILSDLELNSQFIKKELHYEV